MFTFKQRGVCLLCDLFHVFTLSRNNNVCNTMKIVSQIRQIVNVFKKHTINYRLYLCQKVGLFKKTDAFVK